MRLTWPAIPGIVAGMFHHVRPFFLALTLTAAGCATTPPRLQYPATVTTNVVDDYFGTRVADPYRWLEDDH